MSDLVERLRLFEASGPAIPSCQLFGEAADEIERLTESNAIWQEVAKEVTDVAGVNTLIHVPAEIERLRAALKEIQSEVADHFDACAYNIAKAALEDDE
jgi:hypothetical protein